MLILFYVVPWLSKRLQTDRAKCSKQILSTSAYNTGYQFYSVLLSLQGLQDQCQPEATQISHMTTRNSNWNFSDVLKITGANPKMNQNTT